jgi:hypothetical protein
MNIFTLKPPNGEISGPHHCIPADNNNKGCAKCKRHNLECSPLPVGAHRDAVNISRMPPILRGWKASREFAYELENTYIGFDGDSTDEEEEKAKEPRRRLKAVPLRLWVLGRR